MTSLSHPAVVLPRELTREPLSARHPWLFPWAMRAHRVRRHLAWLRPGTTWATTRPVDDLPVRVRRHASLLLRDLAPDEMVLQRNRW